MTNLAWHVHHLIFNVRCVDELCAGKVFGPLYKYNYVVHVIFNARNCESHFWFISFPINIIFQVVFIEMTTANNMPSISCNIIALHCASIQEVWFKTFVFVYLLHKLSNVLCKFLKLRIEKIEQLFWICFHTTFRKLENWKKNLYFCPIQFPERLIFALAN